MESDGVSDSGQQNDMVIQECVSCAPSLPWLLILQIEGIVHRASEIIHVVFPEVVVMTS